MQHKGDIYIAQFISIRIVPLIVGEVFKKDREFWKSEADIESKRNTVLLHSVRIIEESFGVLE